MRILLLCLFLAVLSSDGLAQDSILLMNGRVIKADVLGQSTLEVRYLEFGKSGQARERQEPTSDVFSVTDSLGRERIWYFYDTIFGNDLTVDQMRWFIKGRAGCGRWIQAAPGPPWAVSCSVPAPPSQPTWR